ncbi:efflux RND transporter periplasmic adaptor subunit [Variovorax sp. HJSM1_2]|uniref:efflux RND transporter periplasmic adaptor subunit n=1 Tax=Variovorax sp. HJSM1_2 TaxID=3366263 RepID=UPI003BC00BE8
MLNSLTRLQSRPAFAISLVAAAALLVGGSALFSLGSRAADPAPKDAVKPALTVNVAAPTRLEWSLQLGANGNVAAWQEAVIGSEASGLRLLEVRANVGDVVRKGQPLATFAAEPVLADVAQARANLVEAQANASDAAGNAERARTLQATGALSTQQINQYQTSSETAKARVEAARATLNAQQLRLAQTQVLAPDNGVISARNATVGAVLGSGTELFRLIRGGRLEWRAEVTSTELSRIKPGDAAVLTLASGAKVTGKVRMLAPTVDAQTRNALVYVDLPAHPDARAGMFAHGEFQLGRRAVLTAPESALVVRDGFSYVFEVADGQHASMRRVVTGQRVGDRVEIASGLTPEAKIVVRGGAFLNDGDLVKVQATAPAAATAASPATAASK